MKMDTKLMKRERSVTSGGRQICKIISTVGKTVGRDFETLFYLEIFRRYSLKRKTQNVKHADLINAIVKGKQSRPTLTVCMITLV